MVNRLAVKAYKVQLEVALDMIEQATRLIPGIDSEEKWKAFDELCVKADGLVMWALIGEFIAPQEDQVSLMSTLKQLHANRIEVWINWQMLKREQEANRDPKGKYGMLRHMRKAC